MTIYFSVAEPEPVEPQLLWGSEAGTGAVITVAILAPAPEPKLFFSEKILVILLYCRQFGGCQNE